MNKLDIEITERCNNNCIHCHVNLPAADPVARKGELSTDDLKNILKEAVSLGCLTVRFTGGEPFLREDFAELYVFSRKLGLRVLICTNATLITERLANLFSQIPPLEEIEITVYGMRGSSYETITHNPGSFQAAWQGINLLLKYKIPFGVKQALLPPNRNEMEEFENWAATIPWMHKPPQYSIFYQLRRDRDKRKNARIRKCRVSAQEGLSILTRRKDAYIKEMREFCSKFIRPRGNILFSCGAGAGSVCVDAYGFLKPCMMLGPKDCIYDLRKGSLTDALENFFPKLRQIKAKDIDYLSRCARCFLKGLCQQCPAKSWSEHGRLDKPVAYYCEIAHAQAVYLGLIQKDEKAWEVKGWQERVSKFTRAKFRR